MKFRLNSAEKVAVTLYHVPKTKTINGKDIVTWNNFIRLVPNEEKVTDDEALIQYLRDYRRKVKHTSQLENLLKSKGVPYETEMCKSCGGRVKKIKYQLVEVYDE